MPELCFGAAVFKDGDGMPVAPTYPVVSEKLHGRLDRTARHFFAAARSRRVQARLVPPCE
jgi:hypothetical protein